MEFNCYAVWKFDDDTVYFLGNMNWETRYQGSLIGEEYGVVFIPGLFNANKCDSGFNRSNVEDKTEGPWANDVTTILEQIDP